ncbi:MAG: hypothetical protein AVDCRST_MAG96-797 [uncultured Segetibacter sp.]|uniref:Uncharacterized protein n=1 Tax=uncultured Segetibacter sp. TaxID=481133 RepID=A0A6J4RTY0_9BACT|nr:MAG: hypothetical protein AVDCRST_MAG96-797 [uncultured Segetibacter sp.]
MFRRPFTALPASTAVEFLRPRFNIRLPREFPAVSVVSELELFLLF